MDQTGSRLGMLAEFDEIYKLAPLPFWLAVGFYFSVLLLLLPAFRRLFVRTFSPPEPLTQTQIRPLDSFRGFAALGIACFHTWMWLRPYYDDLAKELPVIKVAYKSVPVFVILSGFLIYRSIRRFTQFEDLRYYVQRRVLRIYPLYIVSVLAYFAIADVRPTPISWFQRLLPEIFMMKVFGFQSFIYPAYWSLYTEELFYLAVPLWVVTTRRRPILSATIGLVVFSLIGSAVPDDTAIMKYFFVGMLACELLETKEMRKLNQGYSALLLVLGLFFLVSEHFYGDVLAQLIGGIAYKLGASLYFDRAYNPADPYQHYYTTTLGIAFGLILLGSIKWRPANRLLSIFPLRFLGTISYSLFIWNGLILLYGTNLFLFTTMPMVSFQDTAFPSILRGTCLSFSLIYMPAFIFSAAVSYALIERPFLLMRAKARIRTSSNSKLIVKNIVRPVIS